MAARITDRPTFNEYKLAAPIMVEGEQLATAVYREMGIDYYAKLVHGTIVPFDPPIAVPQGDLDWFFGATFLRERAATPLREERSNWSRIHGMSLDEIDDDLDAALDELADGEFYLE